MMRFLALLYLSSYAYLDAAFASKQGEEHCFFSSEMLAELFQFAKTEFYCVFVTVRVLFLHRINHFYNILTYIFFFLILVWM